MPQRVLQLHELNKQIVLWIEARSRHGRLKVKAQPFLNPESLQLRAALRQIEEQDEIEHDGRGENRVAAQEVDLDLHGIAEPSEDVDVVPTLFVVTTRWVIVDAHLVVHIAV